MNKTTANSPVVTFLKFLFCAALIFGAFVIGDNTGYKRGFKETVNFTLNKLGVETSVETHNEYNMALDNYVKANNIESILSPENIREKAGDFFKDLLNGLF
jgi:hypothetical protein